MIDAAARALLVGASAFRLPLVDAAVAALIPPPCRRETVAAGSPATLYAPRSADRPSDALLLNGATPLGRRHPGLVRLAEGIARAGFRVLVPDLPGVAQGEVTWQGVRSAVACAHHLAGQGPVALLGISSGTTLALLAAEEPDLAGRVSVVAGTTCYTDLRDLIRLATTGTYETPAGIRPYQAGPFLALCVARSVCAGLDEGPGKRLLAAALEPIGDDHPDPLAPLRELRVVGLDREARAVLELLANRDPARFDALYAALPEPSRQKVDRLSPVKGASRLQAPVELLVDPRDKYFPLEHALALARASPLVRVTTTEALAHADTRRSPRALLDLVRVGGFLVRVLRAARVR